MLLGVVTGVIGLLATPARSATQTIDVGNFYYGSPDTTVINATVGDQLRFVVSTGTNHTVDIAGLGVSSGAFNKDDPPFVVNLDQAGTFTIACSIHAAQGHSVQLDVAPAPTTTTTIATTTTTTIATTTTTSTTTTTLPGGSTTTTLPSGSTTTTTGAPGGTTTTSPGGVTTTSPPGVSTTLAGSTSEATTTSTIVSTGPGVPGASGDGPDPGDQALGVTSPGIDDAGWLRPLWWSILGASVVGLVWVAIAWRRRPTEYD